MVSDADFAKGVEAIKKRSDTKDDKAFTDYMVGVVQLLVSHNTNVVGPTKAHGHVTVTIDGKKVQIFWEDISKIIRDELPSYDPNPLRQWARRLSPLASKLIEVGKVKVAQTTVQKWGVLSGYEGVAFDFFVAPANSSPDQTTAGFMKSKVALSNKGRGSSNNKAYNVTQYIPNFTM